MRKTNGAAAMWIAILVFGCGQAFTSIVLGQEVPDSVGLGEKPILSVPSPLGSIDYRPGRGLHVGDSGLSIGGFVNVKAEDEHESGSEFTLDLLNIFLIYNGIPRLQAVAELQLRDSFVWDEHGAGFDDFAFDVRRLFGDYRLYDELQIQFGTFLTPVGYWNRILAQPLTWTTENPVIVEGNFFDQTTTGVKLHGSTALAEGRIGYEVFSQLLHPIEGDPELDPADKTVGVRLEYSLLPVSAFGVSYQSSRQRNRWSHLASAHAFWRFRRIEVLGEISVQDLPAAPAVDDGKEVAPGDTEQWGLYAQSVLEVYRPLYVVGRYEHLDRPFHQRPIDIFTLGAVYKPWPFMAFKLEYRFSDDRTGGEPEGVYSSFTTLF